MPPGLRSCFLRMITLCSQKHREEGPVDFKAFWINTAMALDNWITKKNQQCFLVSRRWSNWVEICLANWEWGLGGEIYGAANSSWVLNWRGIWVYANPTKKLIGAWSGKKASGAGREVLIESVAHAVPTYPMCCFLIPKNTCRKMKKVIDIWRNHKIMKKIQSRSNICHNCWGH